MNDKIFMKNNMFFVLFRVKTHSYIKTYLKITYYQTSYY